MAYRTPAKEKLVDISHTFTTKELEIALRSFLEEHGLIDSQNIKNWTIDIIPDPKNNQYRLRKYSHTTKVIE